MMKRLYFNGKIHSMVAEDDIFSVMVTEDEKITYTGDEIPSGTFDEKIDLMGKHVYPTMTDSHLHLLYTIVLAAASFNICEITSDGVKPDNMADISKRVKAFCKANPNQKIITANGFIISAVSEKRLPTRFELDEWSDGRAMIVYSIDGHSSAISTKLMEMLKLPTEDSNGIFSGEAHEFMQGKVTNLIASNVTPAIIAKGIANFSNRCASYGISRVCAMDGNEDVENDILTKTLAFLAERMDIDVRLFPQYMDYDRLQSFSKKQKTLRAGGCGVWELDGSVGSHSAAFNEPYKDNGTQGHCYYEKDKIKSKVKEAMDKDIRLSCHAIGESAIDQITEVYSELENRIPTSGAMMRIDHFEFPSEKAVELIKKFPLAITVQPGFSWIDKHFLKSYEQFLPESIINRQLPLKDLMNSDVCVCGSSDSPVQSVNPYEQMLGMVDFYLQDQSITPYEALKTYTVNPAKMLGELGTGTLKTGNDADFFVCDRDILSCKGTDITLCKAEYMVVRGERYKEKKGTVGELLKMIVTKPHKI